MLTLAALLPARHRDTPSVYTRVLLTLRHFDWATSGEIVEAMNVTGAEAVTARTALAYWTRVPRRRWDRAVQARARPRR